MTIDEAIAHCLKVAEQQEISADDREMYSEMLGEDYKGFEEGSQKCAAEHRQLAEWLMDYKNLREENKVLTQECDRLIKEKGELLRKSRHIAEYERLLKEAVEDFTAIAEVHAAATPILCPQYGKYMKAIDIRTRKWRYADEALALIEEDGET